MQCKHCGDDDFETGYEEDFNESMETETVEVHFRCLTCGAVHLLSLNWEDFECLPAPENEMDTL